MSELPEHLSDEELASIAFSREDTPKLRELRHLEACASCRKRVEGVRHAMRAVQPVVEREADASTLDAVCDRVLEEIAPRPARSVAPSVADSARARSLGSAQQLQAARPPGSGFLGGLRVLFPITASVLLALAAGKSAGLSASIGLDCALVELGSAGALLGVFLLLASRAGAARPALLHASRLASIAATGALIGQVWLHSKCEAHDQGLHLFVFHVGAVLLAAALAPLAGRMLRPGGSARG
jgi:hypothetical protein